MEYSAMGGDVGQSAYGRRDTRKCQKELVSSLEIGSGGE